MEQRIMHGCISPIALLNRMSESTANNQVMRRGCIEKTV